MSAGDTEAEELGGKRINTGKCLKKEGTLLGLTV